MKVLQLIATAATLSQTTAVSVQIDYYEYTEDQIARITDAIFPIADLTPNQTSGIVKNIAGCIKGTNTNKKMCNETLEWFVEKVEGQYSSTTV